VTFEAEPGTLTKAKLAVIRELGVTRLSLGVENFGAAVLELNGRGHGPAEAARAYAWARDAGFPQINIDLIAGMLGETDENWQACIEKTLELEPDGVTIYQMELPSNTAIAADTLKGTGRFSEQVAPWATRRRWVREAFDALEQRGYTVGSAYTAVKDPAATKFVYRDRVCQGADLVGLGVASFGYVNGVHLQNLDASDAYDTAVGEGALPLGRAYQPTAEERMIRELLLQLKRGSIRPAYFQQKFDVDVLRRFPSQFAELRADGYLTSATPEGVTLSRGGLLRVDALLPRFFLPAHAGAHPA